ncbi:MAG: FAD/NAD(P)-binding protein [Maribacter sp.]
MTNMLNLMNLAIIGSGPTSIYLLDHIRRNIDNFRPWIRSITIFEKEEFSGTGMPYSPKMTDIHNLANISSEEIPELLGSLGDWLRNLDDGTLASLNVEGGNVTDSEVYPRIALGSYFRAQFSSILEHLKVEGLELKCYSGTEIVDIHIIGENGYSLTDITGKIFRFSAVVIANGHYWKEEDRPGAGYYASPWPMHKLLPKPGTFFNYTIGTLGASLSAFDVVTSLAHCHGKFLRDGRSMRFERAEGTANFKIVLHSAEGWLPHLQYEQAEPLREIYRHFGRNELMCLLDTDGFLRIADYFDILCRSPLICALTKDGQKEISEKLQDKDFGIEDFIAIMSERHSYIDSFAGMKEEMAGARLSVEENRPIHWMETLDDLMYGLNYHAELLPAEDHLFLRKKVMPFLMNVIAALPLRSAEILLALHDAGCLELESGHVAMDENEDGHKGTSIWVTSSEGTSKNFHYKMFVVCAGQKNIGIDEFPFPSLVENGWVSGPIAQFSHYNAYVTNGESEDGLDLKSIGDETYLTLPGITIDSAYRVIGKDGRMNHGIFDVNFTHTSGLRPYSYGLQACSATTSILVESWIQELRGSKDLGTDIEEASEIYERSDEL